MRLIDADELIIMQVHDENDAPIGPSFVPAEFIENAPTIEAVPLKDYRSMEQTVYKLTQALAEAEPKHGRWIEGSDGWLRCSECGRRIRPMPKQDLNEFNKWCGRCGTRMDGEENG